MARPVDLKCSTVRQNPSTASNSVPWRMWKSILFNELRDGRRYRNSYAKATMMDRRIPRTTLLDSIATIRKIRHEDGHGLLTSSNPADVSRTRGGTGQNPIRRILHNSCRSNVEQRRRLKFHAGVRYGKVQFVSKTHRHA